MAHEIEWLSLDSRVLLLCFVPLQNAAHDERRVLAGWKQPHPNIPEAASQPALAVGRRREEEEMTLGHRRWAL